MAKFFEYQGKAYLRQAGIPVPRGQVATSAAQARDVAAAIEGPVVVKAQVWAGGRGKSGAVRFAETPEEAEAAARDILGMEVRGLPVREVLVEEKLAIEHEFYAGVVVDTARAVRAPVVMFSTEGGVDIEAVPSERIALHKVDVLRGLRPHEAVNLVHALGVRGNALSRLSDLLVRLYAMFRTYDCRTLEINPIALTRDGKLYAADCRMAVDDQAVFRHPELGVKLARELPGEPSEFDLIAWRFEEQDFRGTSFVMQMASPAELRKGGYVGYHGIGGGAAMLGIDALNRVGLKAANYADTSGNPTAAKVYRVAKLILSQPGIEGYFLAGFLMANQEQWHHAHALVKALREELPGRPGFPVVLLLCGNKEAESQRILREGLAGLPAVIEIYDRAHVYDAAYLAGRMAQLVQAYRRQRA